jgi:hypothetical protein
MDPAPSSKSLPASTPKWEEVWGTIIALLTLTLPIAAIATYSPSSPPGNMTAAEVSITVK